MSEEELRQELRRRYDSVRQAKEHIDASNTRTFHVSGFIDTYNRRMVQIRSLLQELKRVCSSQ